MKFFRNNSPLAIPQARAEENRRRGRVRADLLETDLGTVLDFSETGLRIQTSMFTRLVPGTERDLMLRSPDGELRCGVEICWARRVRLHQLVGVRFIDGSPEFKARFRALCMSCMDTRTFSAPMDDGDARQAG